MVLSFQSLITITSWAKIPGKWIIRILSESESQTKGLLFHSFGHVEVYSIYFCQPNILKSKCFTYLATEKKPKPTDIMEKLIQS